MYLLIKLQKAWGAFKVVMKDLGSPLLLLIMTLLLALGKKYADTLGINEWLQMAVIVPIAIALAVFALFEEAIRSNHALKKLKSSHE